MSLNQILILMRQWRVIKMSSYTTQLRTIIEQSTQYESSLSQDEIIEAGRKDLFNFDYPIFDETYRRVFETNFIRRFYFREIGFETEGLFKFQLESWLKLNMPYFNKLYESELIKFDPLLNSESNTTYTKDNNKSQNDKTNGTRDSLNKEISNVSESQQSSVTGKSDSVGDSNTSVNENTTDDTTGSKIDDDFNRKINSDNPDKRLSLTVNDGEGAIEYATSIQENTENNKENTQTNSERSKTGTSNTDSTDSTTTSSQLNASSDGDSIVDSEGNIITKDELIRSIKDVEDFVQYRVGKVGVQTYSKMLIEYRQSFLRIEKDFIFDEMQELFMLVY